MAYNTSKPSKPPTPYYGELCVEDDLVKVWNGARWVERPFELSAEQLLAAWDTPEYEPLSNEDVVANLRRVLKLLGL